jgi:hypothetical protein
MLLSFSSLPEEGLETLLTSALLPVSPPPAVDASPGLSSSSSDMLGDGAAGLTPFAQV